MKGLLGQSGGECQGLTNHRESFTPTELFSQQRVSVWHLQVSLPVLLHIANHLQWLKFLNVMSK